MAHQIGGPFNHLPPPAVTHPSHFQDGAATQFSSTASLPSTPTPTYLQQPQSQPSPTVALARTRPPIMDPPRSKASAPLRGVTGFPSPNIDHAKNNPKFMDDTSRMTYAIQQSLGEAVRRSVRDNWEKCLVGSLFHQGFVLNSAINQATPTMLKRSVRDFGSKIVNAAKADLLEHFSQADLDEVANVILGKASHQFLDKALELRLRTIEAKPLVDALSRAERLGYESSDIVEQDAHLQEHVIPANAPAAAHAGGSNRPPGIAAPGTPTENGPTLQCPICFRKFLQNSAYGYHMEKQVCTRAPANPNGFPYSCQHCGQGFANVQVLQYHYNNRICGVQTSTPVQQNVSGPSGIPSTGFPVTPSVSSQQGAPRSGQRAGLSALTPTTENGSPGATMGKTITGTDPYAHLTPEQREQLQEELRVAEVNFAERFKAADAITDANERRIRIEGLRNSFGTKQSMIRKKFGVRLRERRTKKEIEAERERMGLQQDERFGREHVFPATQQPAQQTPPGHPQKGWQNPAALRSGVAATVVMDSNNSAGSDTASAASAEISRKRESTAAALNSDGAAGMVDRKRRRVEGATVTINNLPAQAGGQLEGRASSTHMVDSDSDAQTPDQRDVMETYEAQSKGGQVGAAAETDGGAVQPKKYPKSESDDNDDDDDGDSSSDEEVIPAVLPNTIRQSFEQSSRMGI